MTDDALPELRASDADREQTAEILRQAAGEGRLTMDELDERLDLVYATKTHSELQKLTADVIVAGRRVATPRGARMPVRGGEGGTNWLVSVMSGHDRKGRWRVGPHLKVINVMGGSDLDLNDAELSHEYTEITIVSIMGGGSIRVPDNVNVVVSDFAFMGGNDVQIGEHTQDPGGPTIHLKLFSLMGGNDIKRGRKLSRDEKRQLRDERRALQRSRHEERRDRAD